MKIMMVDCEWEKFNNEEAMKLVIMLHTHNPTLQRQMLTKNLDFKTTRNFRASRSRDRLSSRQTR
jgi:hypothetical protein